MNRTLTLAALAVALGLAPLAQAGFLVEPRSGGKGFANFSLGGATTTASNSSATSTAFGITPALGSIFGGDAPSGTSTPTPDTYLFRYTPGTDADNLVVPASTPLNNDGDFGAGLVGGDTGLYRVYATWPTTSNISAGNSPTNYVLSGPSGTILSVSVDQNDIPVGTKGNEWFLLGETTLVAGSTYTVTQTNTQVVVDDGFGTITYTNGFVSQRSSGVLFQKVPEPASALLVVGALCGLARRRR